MNVATSAMRGKLREMLITLPSLAWLCVFFLLPTIMMFAVAFRPADPMGGIGEGWTLETVRRLANPNYPSIIWRTIWLSVAATAICLLLATPMGYFLSRVNNRWRQWLILLVVVPFWVNFLIRVFAWKTLLHADGVLCRSLQWLGILGPNETLMYTQGAILLVLVYAHLPFAILPVYAAAEKFDFSLLEAARDLGASSTRAFVSVFVPGISRGMATAAIMVLVPCLGAYVIPDLVGGATSEMIGNKIVQYILTERNLPRASALSAVLTVVVVALMLLSLWWMDRRGRGKTGEDAGKGMLP